MPVRCSAGSTKSTTALEVSSCRSWLWIRGRRAVQVLVADDDILCGEFLREVLRSFGHDCVVVHDGDAAWRHLVAYGADVVISDWHMPGLSGVQLCERVRGHPEIACPYFILLTGRSDRGDIPTSLRAGVDDCLAKPVDFDLLESQLIAAERRRTLRVAT